MDELLRQAVRSRAGNRCEYCHLPEAHVVTPYQVEHVIARQHAGSGSLANLAYYPGNKEGHIPTRSASEGPMKSSESRRRSPLDD